MISSNYDIVLAKLDSNNSLKSGVNSSFLNSVENILASDKRRDSSLTFENINGITLEEIDELFIEEDKELAKNLRLATTFTDDEKLSKALFNTVLGLPFDMGIDYLTNRYSDKNSYLKSKYSSSPNSLFDMLHKSMVYRLDNSKSFEIKKEDLDDILLQVHSFDFLSALSTSSKKGSDKYKDDNRYSFLYRNYEQEYKDLIEKYQDFDKKNLDIIKQF